MNVLSPATGHIPMLPLMALPPRCPLVNERVCFRRCSLSGNARSNRPCRVRYHRLGVDEATRDRVSRCALSAAITRISRTSLAVPPPDIRISNKITHPLECSLTGQQSITPRQAIRYYRSRVRRLTKQCISRDALSLAMSRVSRTSHKVSL